ncbi:phosphoribosylanthranilate isomerase [Enterococcus sp. LJL99]
MKVKICGLKNKLAVDHAVANGADFLGFVFAASKREVDPKTVREITVDVPNSVKKVGVFVSPTLDEVEAIIEAAGLDLVQVHGEQLKEKASVPMISALPVDGTDYVLTLQDATPDYLLFDAPPQEFIGGNGVVFDWDRLDLSALNEQKIIIAGGLTPENVQAAVKHFRPYALDVSSGVETNGEKDLTKITNFIRNAKEEI